MSQQGHAVSTGRDPGHLSSDPRHSVPGRSDGALPHRWLRALRSRTPRQGEQRLALAVLEDAVHEVWRNRHWARLRHFLPASEAERWIASRDRVPLFSFENVCLILSVEAAEMRKLILRRRARPSEPAVQGAAHIARWGAERLRGTSSLRA